MAIDLLLEHPEKINWDFVKKLKVPKDLYDTFIERGLINKEEAK